MWQPKTILALSPHADDMEIGAGGTVRKWIKQGATCRSIVFSTLNIPDRIRQEIQPSHQVLGIQRVSVYDYNNRYFYRHRQDILQLLVNLNMEPDVVLVPATFDEHQDHQVVCAEAKRAFKKSTILGYEDPWNSTKFNLPMISRLDELDMDDKIKSVLCHTSQLNRPYMNETFIRGLASVRGAIIGVPHAEAFEVIKLVN